MSNLPSLLITLYLPGNNLEEWNAAYSRVEAYLNALGIQNKLLRNQITLIAILRAIQQAQHQEGVSPTIIAAREMNAMLNEWFSKILNQPTTEVDPMLSVKGRLAMALADIPGRWQHLFLNPGPWPEEFVIAVREGLIKAGPEFQISHTAPHPLDLGPISKLTVIARLPYAKLVLGWIAFAILLYVIFRLTH